MNKEPTYQPANKAKPNQQIANLYQPISRIQPAEPVQLIWISRVEGWPFTANFTALVQKLDVCSGTIVVYFVTHD